MGNCSGYCISDGPDNKRKVTVEQKEGDGGHQNNVAYINDANKIKIAVVTASRTKIQVLSNS